MNRSSDLLAIIQSGIDAVRPSLLFPPLLSKREGGIASWITASDRFLLALGKASVDSAKSVLSSVSCRSYFVLSPYSDPENRITAHIGSHPIPGRNSYEATLQLVDWLTQLPARGSLLVILSGGASALCVLPPATVSLQSKMQVNDLLIRSGAAIQEINTVRKHLSAVKGGQLAAKTSHLNTQVLVISDVIGDDLSSIGSGPFYPDPTTFLDARTVLLKYGLWEQVPDDVRETIDAGFAKRIPDTPKPGSLHIDHKIIASNRIAVDATVERARDLGYSIRRFEKTIQEDVEQAANMLFSEIQRTPKRTAVIAGGEVTVRLRGNGTGGRNQHLTLLMTEKLQGLDVIFGAVGTDGIDGNSTAAGAWTDGQTMQKAGGFEAYQIALRDCDSYHYFHTVGKNIVPGPTGTNVMDLYVALT